ncbi:MAG: manganese efflux pump [Erysipelotrichaceae bacterium]|nr:manganese efflux pump [Erysipelotrichaceae bacterium]
MSLFEIILLAIGVSMDAFAVSICKGLSIREESVRLPIICGLYFGLSQGLMTVLGYLLGGNFAHLVASFDHWIAFICLAYIGCSMIKEVIEDSEETMDDKTDVRTMLILSIATSIDALSVGFTMAFLSVNIVLASTLITIATFSFSFAGVYIGRRFGRRYQNKAKLAGGIILIFIGIRIVLEHLGIIG